MSRTGARRRVPGWRLAVAVILGGASVWFSIAGMDWQPVRASIAAASPPWLVAAVAAVIVTLALVVWRWSVLAAPASGRLGVIVQAVVVGQAANIVLPLRLGEGARVAITAHGLARPVSGVVVSLVLERICDVGAFLAAALVVLAAGWVPPGLLGNLTGAAILLAVLLTMLPLSVRLLPAALREIRRRLAPGRLTDWLSRQEHAVERAAMHGVSGHTLAASALLTAVIFAGSAAVNLLVFRAFALPVPPAAAVVLLIVLQVGTAVVSVPGNLGVFHFLTILTLGAWSVPRPSALAAALVLHVVTLGPKVALGAIFVAASPGLRSARVEADHTP